ncbi:2-dehydro-3-deoxy-D-gluconate 5-dehydrogenase KduD [Halomonas eurihalina]|uniref:2-dehydro-3-deoxy-D-gluconate 5-dehydrogenase n=1 Tax=Halomonas eurihalina TaxID=42566 RepID=A0A5D9CSI7_HALER|nr:2-dehydro-3-deoxy-D-gluconate 5-dehydrogenase KduD [Halomonas eurihalina]MDR5860388.1 2-dehydro-3-deoxy-D-gluconate 5-dehydrogenase KduD [Halomonas eurihalina]TZG33980.1 2-dehydro-3-deoxy-D-gluconate 5-dehydrogenase KduD [Halomonas eurihalina]
MSQLFNLSGKTAIVTGCNTGLGQGMALGLASAGCNIVAVNRRSPEETQRRVEAMGVSLLPVEADLASTTPIDDILAQAEEHFGGADILVNNAGIIRRSDALDFTEKDWDDVMDVNLKNLFFLSQAFARSCIEGQRRGKIINIASMLSFQGGIRVPSYTASKSGVLGLTRLMANEWASHGINANAIAPGYMATNNTEALRNDPERSREILGRIPAGRWGEPEDLAGAAVFLASDASNYVHGHTLAVDGGWLAR